MSKNTFEPDTVIVRAHTRKPAKRDTTALPDSFEPAGGTSEGAGAGGYFDYEPETAFGAPIKARKATIDAMINVGGGLASLVAPEVSGPAWLVKAAQAAGPLKGVVGAVPGAVSRAAMAFGG